MTETPSEQGIDGPNAAQLMLRLAQRQQEIDDQLLQLANAQREQAETLLPLLKKLIEQLTQAPDEDSGPALGEVLSDMSDRIKRIDHNTILVAKHLIGPGQPSPG